MRLSIGLPFCGSNEHMGTVSPSLLTVSCTHVTWSPSAHPRAWGIANPVGACVLCSLNASPHSVQAVPSALSALVLARVLLKHISHQNP